MAYPFEDNDGDDEEDLDKDENDQLKEADDDILGEDLSDGDLTIDELDKANLFGKKAGGNGKNSSMRKKQCPLKEIVCGEDRTNNHERCKEVSPVCLPGLENFRVEQNTKETMILEEQDGVVGVTVCTPIRSIIQSTEEQGSTSGTKNMEYCEELLKYVDMINSDDEVVAEEDMETLLDKAMKSFVLVV